MRLCYVQKRIKFKILLCQASLVISMQACIWELFILVSTHSVCSSLSWAAHGDILVPCCCSSTWQHHAPLYVGHLFRKVVLWIYIVFLLALPKLYFPMLKHYCLWFIDVMFAVLLRGPSKTLYWSLVTYQYTQHTGLEWTAYQEMSEY